MANRGYVEPMAADLGKIGVPIDQWVKDMLDLLGARHLVGLTSVTMVRCVSGKFLAIISAIVVARTALI